MARIKKYSPEQNLSSFQTFLIDDNPNSDYFRITEFKDTFTGGKNGFLIEGSEYLKESTEIKIELLDVAGNPIYFEPGNGIPEYYEGISKLIAVYIYNDTPIGLGKITILGELKQYDDNGVKRDIPDQWKGAYNVKWERTFQINKLLANEDKVRFYRRPEVTIDEIVKPIFSGNPPVVTQTGVVDGIPLVPTEGTDLSNFTLPTNYRLKIKSGNKWTGSIDEEIITFDNIDYAPKIEEVVNENEIIVSPPYEENNVVKSFTDESYSLEFPYIENVADLATALTGSFAKISITDMKTFVGDAARVKVFRRSQSNLTDFEFVQEIQLESNEVLRDITTFAKKEEPYGFFTQPVIAEYWVTSSNDFNVTFNQDVLYNSAKLDSSPDNFFFTTESFSVQNGVEYTLDFNVRKGLNTSGDYLKVFLSGSNGSNSVSQTITTIDSSNGILQKTNINENIIADTFDSARLYFEVSGSDWYVNNVSLKASQETSFSPDEITFVQQVPKFLVTETFDYRFEFYDINNNYIPVRVEDTKTFVGGNVNLFEKDIEITPDNLYFSFDSASNPANALPPTIINLEVSTDLVTGSITYTSGAYDLKGNLLSSSQYVGGQYPGYLTDWDVNFGRQPFLRVEDFTGSRDDITVQFIRYTGAIEGVSDTFVISRVEDGKGGVSFEIVPFRGVQIKNKESKTLEIQAVRVDGINRINLRSGLERGFSDAKLHVLSSSLDGTQTYVSLSQAITNSDFLEGVSVGETGSGEIDYNAIFNRDAIDNELTVYLMDGPLSESILTSQILTDLKDGLNPGLVTSTADQFNIKYKPREAFSFDPTEIIVTSSFQQRGTTLNPLSASLKVIPSASIAPLTELPELFVFYETGAFDDSISVVVTDFVGNVIDSGVPGVTAGVSYYDAVETKQLNFEFTYTEPITSASVTANKSFFITPDGLPGQDSITIDIDPNPVALGSNHKGDVYNYGLADTDIQITQGDLFLINTASGNPGTFTTTSIVPINITYGTLVGDSTTTMSLAGFETMSALSASVQYNFDIYPYFTASLITASRTQKFTKVVEGGGPIEVTLDPIATALNADEIGYVSNYSSATTEVFIKQNDEFFFYDEFDGGRPGTFVTASISASNIEFTELSSSFRDLSVSGSISSSGGEVLHFKGFGGLANNQPSASITYNFKVYPYSLTAGVAGVPRIVSKTQTFSKVNDGTAARKVSLVASSDTVIYDGDGVKVAPSGDVVLSATAINVTGSAFFKFLNVDGSTIQASSTTNTATIGDLPATGSTKTFTVELRDGTSDGTVVDTDSVTVSGIAEGSAAYSVALSNPASSVTVEVDGTTYFDNAGTLIRAYKGGTELQYVEEYDESAVDPITFLPIGTFGQFSASIHEISSFLTQGTLRDGKEIVSKSISPTEDELFASSSAVTNWNTPESNTQGFITFKIDFENGRGTQFVQQSFSTVFEGATGPGIVVRGEWDEEIAYIFDLTQKRRDAVFREISGDVHYWATTEELINKSEYTEESDGLGNDDGIYTAQPVYNVGSPPSEGDIDAGGWQYLGQQDFFVAAKLAIFEESFVKNTIKVGEPPAGNPNANIAIVGGTDEPYISVGQTGTQGYGQMGAFIGLTNDGGPAGTAGTTGLLSLSGDPTEPSHNSLKWDGQTLRIRGAIRQTSAGSIEPQLRGPWTDGAYYNTDDSVLYLNQSFRANAPHTASQGDSTNGEPNVGTKWDSSSGTGKTVSLGASTFVIEFDQDGNNPSPSSINVFASSSNFVDPYFKFTGGGTIWTGDGTTFTDSGETNGNNEIVTGINLSSTTISDMPLQFRVGVADGGLSGQGQVELISDVINIFGVKPGSDTVPNYFITPIAGGTQIKNSSGTIELQVQKADISGITNITSGTDARIYDTGTGDLITSSIHATEAVVGGVVYNPTLGSGFINGTKTLLLKDNGGTVLDSITLLDVTDGLGGGSFISPNLKMTRQANNTYLPSNTSLTASFYDTSGTEFTKAVAIYPNLDGGTDYMYYTNDSGDHTDSEISLTIDDGDGVVFSGTGIGNKLPTKDVVVTATFTDPSTGQTNTMVETVYIVSDGVDGIDAITVINTNQAHPLPASSAGVVSSYTNSGTDIRVFEGVNELAYDGTGTSVSTWTVSTSQSPTSTITIGSITDNGNDITIGDHSAMANGTDSVTITYSISGTRANGESFVAETTQTLTKAPAGSDAESIRLSADSQIFRIAQDGTVSPSTITFTANRQNLTNTTTFTTNPSPLTIGTPATDVATLTYNNFSQGGAHTAVTITATAGSVSDEITIVEVREGTNALTVILSNETHTLPAESNGNVSSYVGSGTTITVFEGATELNHDNGGDGGFDVTATGTNITAGTISDSGNKASVANHSNMTADLASVEYEIDITRLDGTSVTLFKTQSFSKAKSGTDGADGDASGIVYAGAWEVGTNNTYSNPTEYLSGDLKYVVKYNDGSGDAFYTTEIEHYHRGAWVANTQDYAINDIVTYSSTYWRANTSITGQARTTNPQASSNWDSLGAASNLVPSNGGGGLQLDGDDAFGLFGAQFTSVATDILFAEDVYANRTINVGTGENNKPVISLNADTENDSASPYISIGQVTQSFEEDGIFLGFPSESSSPVMSLVSGSDYLIYNDGIIALSNAAIQGTGSNAIIQGPGLQIGYKLDTQYNKSDNRSYNFTVTQAGVVSAAQAYVQGTINATDGTIGQWIIQPPDEDANGNYIDGTGGILQDTDGEVRLDPNVGEIQIYSASYDDTSIEFPATSSVTAASGKFYIDYGNGAEEAPVIHLERSVYNPTQGTIGLVQDEGYYFDLSDSSMAGHEFSFSMRVDGVGTYGGRYNKSTTLDTSETGQDFLIITSSASPGSTGAYIQITPSASMASPWAGGNELVGDPSSMEFHYYCENHTGMGNRTYIYNDGLAIERVATYIERVTIGSQDSFTSTTGGTGNFSFTQNTTNTLYKLLSGTTTTNQYGFLETATANEYTAFSTPLTNLDAGPITLTDIEYPSLHVNSNNIPNASFSSPSPQYQPSYNGQVHGGANLMFFYASPGYRRIYQYLELWNDDDDELIGTKYLNQVSSYGANDSTHMWVASDSGGGGIQSVVGTTKITLEDGTTKLAKDITLDDKILAWDSDTDKWVSARLSDIKKRNVSEIYKITIDGREIEVSETHGFWLFGNEKNSGQIRASELYKNRLLANPMTQDILKLWVKDGDSKKKVSITNITKIEKEEEVITFSVPKYVNYVSNNIISHNVFGSLAWYQQSMGSADTADGAKTGAGGTTSWDVEIPKSGNYKVRFRISLSSRASTSMTVGTSSSATQTTTYNSFNFYFDSDSSAQTGHVNSGNKTSAFPWNTTINIQKNNNFIEILPAGIQVVSGTGRFVRINRKDQNDDDVELLEVIDGAVKIESRNAVSSGTSFDDKLAIEADGNIMPMTTANANPSTSGWDLGGTSNYWKSIYTRELNGVPIGTMQLVAACYFNVSTSGGVLGPYNTHNVSGVTRSQKGRFTVSLTYTDGFTLSSGLGFAAGYGRNGATDAGPGTNIGDNEFTFNVGVKVKSTNVEINVKDNNNDSDRDPKEVYFVLFSD